jgi:hypothetical protein
MRHSSAPVALPSIALLRQRLASHPLADIEAAVRNTLAASGMAARLQPGAEVAIGVGSRGIANLAQIVGAAVAWWRAAGMRPFLFPAMGSHGAATARGQAEVLASYGITEAAMGCPVRSSLAVEALGTNEEGIAVVMDRTAFRAGGVMLCGRVKWHTDFEGAIESGLFKMMAIGLGKLAGAQRYHRAAYRLGLEAMVRSVGRRVLASGRILGGLAILEDGYHQTAHVEAVGIDGMERREEELLRLAKSWMPRLPADVDVLMVDELGKNYSGSGLDTKIVNRAVWGAVNPWPAAARVGRIYVRDLAAASHGNATGIGMADAVHRRMLAQVRRQPTYVNALTSGQPASIRTPIHFASDRAALAALCAIVGRERPEEARLAWIANTLDLAPLAVSASLFDELRGLPEMTVVAEPRVLPFDAQGDLPRSVAELF